MYWKKQLKKGQVFLSKQELQKALKCFESAVTDCPVSSRSGLDKSLFYLGITLKRLGRTDSAIRCWHIANKIKKDGYSTKMIHQHSNPSIEDDKEAFIRIQIEKYLEMKIVNRFCSAAEKDVVLEIILNYWLELRSNGDLDHLSSANKMNFFKNQIIIFPFSNISYIENNSTVIFADFDSGKQISLNELCSCGSGLQKNQCCGRIKFSEELGVGDF